MENTDHDEDSDLPDLDDPSQLPPELLRQQLNAQRTVLHVHRGSLLLTLSTGNTPAQLASVNNLALDLIASNVDASFLKLEPVLEQDTPSGRWKPLRREPRSDFKQRYARYRDAGGRAPISEFVVRCTELLNYRASINDWEKRVGSDTVSYWAAIGPRE